MKPAACPCGSGRPIEACCGRYLDSQAPAPDAEALMRSRYTAYVLGREAYLMATWHAVTRPPTLDFGTTAQLRWFDLKVLRHTAQDADHATVEFVARYKVGGRAYRMNETSRFMREDGRWFYVDGDVGE